MPASFIFFLRATILSALLLQAGCGGSTPPVSAPEFLIVVNDNATGTGLVEYSLPLVSGQAPVTTLASQGTYLGGFSDQSTLFAFGEGALNAPTLWRYSLPLSTSSLPAALTGLGGIPAGGTALAGGSVVVFLEKNTSTHSACLETFNLSTLLNASDGSSVTASAPCSSLPITAPSGATGFLTGAIQLSSDGSDLFVEAVYQTTGGVQTVLQTYSPSNYSLTASMFAQNSYPSGTALLEGASESGNVVLLIPHPSTPGVDFYTVTTLINPSNNGQIVSPIYASPITLSQVPTLLALDIFGTYLYTAQSNGTGPSVASFGLDAVQNEANATPLAQTGSGLSLTPSGLVVVVSSSG